MHSKVTRIHFKSLGEGFRHALHSSQRQVQIASRAGDDDPKEVRRNKVEKHRKCLF